MTSAPHKRITIAPPTAPAITGTRSSFGLDGDEVAGGPPRFVLVALDLVVLELETKGEVAASSVTRKDSNVNGTTLMLPILTTSIVWFPRSTGWVLKMLTLVRAWSGLSPLNSNG